MNALIPILQFSPYIEIFVRIILFIVIIYMLLGPLSKLIKAAVLNLNTQKSDTQTFVTNEDDVTPVTSEETSAE